MNNLVYVIFNILMKDSTFIYGKVTTETIELLFDDIKDIDITNIYKNKDKDIQNI